jgi:hypothetical protein
MGKNSRHSGPSRRRHVGLGGVRSVGAASTLVKESQIQKAYWEYLNLIPVFIDNWAGSVGDFSYAVPNGTWVPGQRASKIIGSLLGQGLRPGVSDIVIAYPVGPHHGAYMELKRDRKSKVSDDQIDWLARVRMVGYFGEFCYGLDDAILKTQRYLTGGKMDPLPPKKKSVVESASTTRA